MEQPVRKTPLPNTPEFEEKAGLAARRHIHATVASLLYENYVEKRYPRTMEELADCLCVDLSNVKRTKNYRAHRILRLCHIFQNEAGDWFPEREKWIEKST